MRRRGTLIFGQFLIGLVCSVAWGEARAGRSTVREDGGTEFVVLEETHWAGHRPRPDKPMDASRHDLVLAKWNLGGTGDPSYPTNRSQFHAAVRVIVDTKVLSGRVPRTSKQALSQRDILAQARSKGYWLLRACYEDTLRAHAAAPHTTPRASRAPRSQAERVWQEQQARRKASPRGKTVLKFSIGPDGRVPYARRVSSVFDKSTVECFEAATRQLAFSPAPGRRLDVQMTLQVSPGDAPVMALETSPYALDGLPSLQRVERLFTAMQGQVQRCYQEALHRDGKLWGRVELRLSLDPRGRVQAVQQGTSAFPDERVVECVTGLLEGKPLPVQRPSPPPADERTKLASSAAALSLAAAAKQAAGRAPELVVAWRLKPGQKPGDDEEQEGAP